jgi:hypothetical protein
MTRRIVPSQFPRALMVYTVSNRSRRIIEIAAPSCLHITKVNGWIQFYSITVGEEHLKFRSLSLFTPSHLQTWANTNRGAISQQLLLVSVGTTFS